MREKSPGTRSQSHLAPRPWILQDYKVSKVRYQKKATNTKAEHIQLQILVSSIGNVLSSQFFSSALQILPLLSSFKKVKWTIPSDITTASNGINCSQPVSLPYLLAVFAKCIILKTLKLWESQERFINQDVFWKHTRTGPQKLGNKKKYIVSPWVSLTWRKECASPDLEW